MLFFIFLSAAFNATLLLVADKHRLLDWYDMNRKLWMPERCELCLCFWLTNLEMLVIQIMPPADFSDWWKFVLVALCSPSLSLLIRNR